MKNLPLWAGLLLFVGLTSCQKWNLDRKNFLELEITDYQLLSIDSLYIQGRITGLEFGVLEDHGFLWATQETAPDYFFNEGIASLAIKTSENDPTFSAELLLEPNTHYLLRAYATEDGKAYWYSEVISFTTGSAAVFTLGLNYQQGYSLEARGRLSGTEKGLVALKHGFCWSVANPEPSLSDRSVNLGTRRNNDVFEGMVDSLQNGVPNYVRAYAIMSSNFELDTVFGEVLIFDGDLEFWAQKADFGGEPDRDAVGFSIEDKGYMLANGGLWEYDPIANSWTQKAAFENTLISSATGFSIESKGYLHLLDEFWQYDPAINTWTQKATFGGGPRDGAAAFSIGTKGYLGTGTSGISFFETRDFWEYDPTDTSNGLDEHGNPMGKWTSKADFGGGLRSGAVAFSIGNRGYVGLGYSPGFPNVLNQDFWEYNPEDTSNGLDDNGNPMGKWIRRADFGGGLRSSAIAFALGTKAYVGTGYDGAIRNDLWQYDPATDVWRRKSPFSGGPRISAIAFSIGTKGYLGMGWSNGFRKDFWEYDP